MQPNYTAQRNSSRTPALLRLALRLNLSGNPGTTLTTVSLLKSAFENPIARHFCAPRSLPAPARRWRAQGRWSRWNALACTTDLNSFPGTGCGAQAFFFFFCREIITCSEKSPRPVINATPDRFCGSAKRGPATFRKRRADFEFAGGRPTRIRIRRFWIGSVCYGDAWLFLRSAIRNAKWYVLRLPIHGIFAWKLVCGWDSSRYFNSPDTVRALKMSILCLFYV